MSECCATNAVSNSRGNNNNLRANLNFRSRGIRHGIRNQSWGQMYDHSEVLLGAIPLVAMLIV